MYPNESYALEAELVRLRLRDDQRREDRRLSLRGLALGGFILFDVKGPRRDETLRLWDEVVAELR